MPSRIADVPRSTAYLLLSFPLGIAYFTFVVSAAAAGAALLVFVVGAFVLAGALAVSRRVAAVDAALGARVFGLSAPDLPSPEHDGSFAAAALAEFAAPSGYRGVVYLLARFAVGVAGFVLVVTWLSVSAALLAAPFVYDDANYTIGAVGVWEVQSLPAALAVAALGVVAAVLGALVVAAAGRVAARATMLVLTFPED